MPAYHRCVRARVCLCVCVCACRRPVLPEELRSIQRVVLLSWQLEVQRATRLRCLGTRLATAHLARLTHAWREQALVLRCKRAARCRAEAHRRQRLLGTALCVLGSQRVWAAEALCVLTVKLDRLRARNAFKVSGIITQTASHCTSLQLPADHPSRTWNPRWQMLPPSKTVQPCVSLCGGLHAHVVCRPGTTCACFERTSRSACSGFAAHRPLPRGTHTRTTGTQSTHA